MTDNEKEKYLNDKIKIYREAYHLGMDLPHALETCFLIDDIISAAASSLVRDMIRSGLDDDRIEIK